MRRIIFGVSVGFGSLLLALGLADSVPDFLLIYMGLAFFGGGFLGGLELVLNTLKGEK